ncbi:MAG TPA: DUF1622 domain-containing protein [Candidatus Bilamarchaeum sp.]|nr:DUF1622 domain-containing protein [Candidatus Bilamarchaeum sp.]
MEEAIATGLSYVSLFFDIVGIALIIYGGLSGLYMAVRTELKNEKKFMGYEEAKRFFIQKLVFALDFFLASDLLRLVSVNDINSVITLGAIVAIRTVLSWSLGREVRKEG